MVQQKRMSWGLEVVGKKRSKKADWMSRPSSFFFWVEVKRQGKEGEERLIDTRPGVVRIGYLVAGVASVMVAEKGIGDEG